MVLAVFGSLAFMLVLPWVHPAVVLALFRVRLLVVDIGLAVPAAVVASVQSAVVELAVVLVLLLVEV